MVRRYLIALSFVNLCYAPIWRRLLYFRQATEFGMKNLPGRDQYAAAIKADLASTRMWIRHLSHMASGKGTSGQGNKQEKSAPIQPKIAPA